MKKVLAVVSAALLALSLAGCSKAAEKGEYTQKKGKLMVGTEIGYPPMEYFAEDGKTPVGFDMEMADLLAKKLGLECEIVDTAWDGIFAGLATDRYDVVISSVTMTPERAESMDFSDSYIGNGQTIILRKDSTLNVTKPEDLKDLTVAYQSLCTSDFFMQKQAAAGLTFKADGFDKVTMAFDELASKRCDAVVADALVSAAYLGPDSEFKLVWTGAADEHFGIAVKKGNAALLAKVNEALAALKADGSLSEVSKKTFGSDLIPADK